MTSVPQGSVLGPLLFNVFINYILDCLHYASSLFYADDLKMFIQIVVTERISRPFRQGSRMVHGQYYFFNVNKS